MVRRFAIIGFIIFKILFAEDNIPSLEAPVAGTNDPTSVIVNPASIYTVKKIEIVDFVHLKIEVGASLFQTLNMLLEYLQIIPELCNQLILIFPVKRIVTFSFVGSQSSRRYALATGLYGNAFGVKFSQYGDVQIGYLLYKFRKFKLGISTNVWKGKFFLPNTGLVYLLSDSVHLIIDRNWQTNNWIFRISTPRTKDNFTAGFIIKNNDVVVDFAYAIRIFKKSIIGGAVFAGWENDDKKDILHTTLLMYGAKAKFVIKF